MAQSNGELRQEFAKLFKSYSVGVSAGMLATRAKTVDDAEEHLNAVITLAEQLFTRYRKQHELEAQIKVLEEMRDKMFNLYHIVSATMNDKDAISAFDYEFEERLAELKSQGGKHDSIEQ